jgi:hypothetical protein
VIGWFALLLSCSGGASRPDSGSANPGASAGPCLLAPDSTGGDDLGSAARALAVSRGSASDPIPIDLAIACPGERSCVDGEGGLWVVTRDRVLRYSADLDRSLDLELGSESTFSDPMTYACGERGVLVWATTMKGAIANTTVFRYTSEGLVDQFQVTSSRPAYSLRSSPVGPLLIFGTPDILVDGVSYAPPASSNTVVGVYRLKPQQDVPRMVWVPQVFGMEPDGSFLAVHIERSGALTFERYSPTGNLVATSSVAGHFSSLEPATMAPDGHLIVAGDGYFALPTATHVGLPSGFVLSLDRNGTVAWQQQLRSPGDVSIFGVAVGPESDTWVYGRFEEWVEVGDEAGDKAAFGHLGEYDARLSSGGMMGWDHRFVAVLDTQGSLRALEPMGEDFDPKFQLFPFDDLRAFMVGSMPTSADASKQFGMTGALPVDFLGRMDLAGRTPTTMPPQPTEALPLLPLPDIDGTIASVQSSHDGNAYVVFETTQGLIFVDYPSGQVLPPFQPPSGDAHQQAFERAGDELFLLDRSLPRLRVFRLREGVWSDQGELPLETPRGDYCTKLLPSGEWLFVACESQINVYRRQGGVWTSFAQAKQGGQALDFAGTSLVVGDSRARGQRTDEGEVRLYGVSAGGLSGPTVLKPSDPLPYQPAPPCDGDVCNDPPPGKAFGSEVQLADDWLLVEDDEGSTGFECVGTTWRERWKHLHSGQAMLHDGALVVFDSGVNRGRTYASGALSIVEPSSTGSIQRQRIAPTQRWPSAFASSHVLVQDRLLVGAPGYGKLEHGVPGKGGVVFSLPFAACPDRP